MFDYDALAALSAVIREGSFERAARALHVTPSAISQRIRLLEERTGCALVIRGQPCEATATGRQLCLHADRVRLLEQECRQTLPGLFPDSPQRAPLSVAVNADSLASWFADAMAAFAAEAPVLVQVAVDDQDHTGSWLKNGEVMAAVTSTAQPATGCNAFALGAMRYRATASPAYMQRYFPDGVDATSLKNAPSLLFNQKDTLQARWVLQVCGEDIPLQRHSLPSSHAFVNATRAGMGWGMNPDLLVASYLADGSLVELIPDTPLDVPLYWQSARASSGLLNDFSQHILRAARAALIPL